LSIVCCLSLCVNTDYTASWQIIQDVICKSTENEVKKCFCVWDVDAAGSNPVTPTKFGFGKQFPKPFSLPTALQILRADGLFSSAPLGIHFYSINWNLFY